MAVYIGGIGLVTPAGVGAEATWEALRGGARAIGPLGLFPAPPQGALPVAEVPGFDAGVEELPRTHRLALAAADEAMAAARLDAPPGAVVLGGTTGGIPTTEALLRDGVEDPAAYRWHGAGTVADLVAEHVGCTGPAIAVATACSSGAVALDVALEMLRRGEVETALAGGVDALCRLTYHGFAMLKVIDPTGAKPVDVERAGMTVGEGAAMLLLRRADSPPPGAVARLLGGGLSCDAHHPSSPHPEGVGALAAMRAALADAGVTPADIDHVHLHGTGTKDNDASEAKALRALFGERSLPPHASVKGALGHAVGAAGAVGAALSALALRDGVVPGNVGCVRPDPALGLTPTREATRVEGLKIVLADSFGFGGNNAALVLGRPEAGPTVTPRRGTPVERFAVVAAACVTGAGRTEASLRALDAGEPLAGVMDSKAMVEGLPPRKIRRIKRLPRMALALAGELGEDGAPPAGVHALFLGTAWGALTETHGFLRRLFESNETSSSPTEFVGSVHNAIAGQVAMWLGATGPNITVTTGDRSFDEAFALAGLFTTAEQRGRTLVMGLDEAQEVLTPRLDPAPGGAPAADGGGALLLEPATAGDERVTVRAALRRRGATAATMQELVDVMGGVEALSERIGALWTGAPAADADLAGEQLARLDDLVGGEVARLDYRAALGHFAAAPAAAVALSARALAAGSRQIPAGRGVLVVSLGRAVSAIELLPGRPR